MSLFQNKSDYFLKGEDQLDVFHLGPHGCDVMFSRYEAGTEVHSATNSTLSKCLVVQGRLTVTQQGLTRHYGTGDWYEVPAMTEHDIHYLSDCSIIEFWFDPPAP
ncbi:hypothetical protein [Ketobacter sp.]|uniref:hypothetical protein n=1 Tax=Ketobacter sp. TaxID=2083498 RepID=UPI000F0D8920|nr:hypothetical protein [Ketobacter sp.]RLT93252.1 MAG: cupin domain-containing protein [Ketobacter sp.]